LKKNHVFRPNIGPGATALFPPAQASDIVFTLRGKLSMTAEIIDLGKYRELKNRSANHILATQPETANDLKPLEPTLAQLEKLRNKDSGDPV
jgi:hypothetical protein